MAKDLTAILLPQGQLSVDEVVRAIGEMGDGLVRVKPLDSVKLVQVEVFELDDGLPRATPEIVARLAENGRATFVHANHSAKQGLLHSFYPSGPQPGFAGAPGDELDAKLREAVGATLAEITAADDGSRIGIGVAATQTMALVRGRKIWVPPGMPTDLGSFSFRDRGRSGGERLGWFAFDAQAAAQRFSSTPGRELAAQLLAAPAGAFGPLEGVRAEVVDALTKIGDATPAAAGVRDVRAYELCALDEARAFCAGDRVSYWDERVLPLFGVGDGDPVIAENEVEDLDDLASVLHALVEVMPYPAPPGGEGSMLASIADAELGPLAPWAKAGDEYTGTVFTLAPARLLELVRRLDGDRLRARVERFERAWYRVARPGQPEGDALQQFMRAHAEEGAADIERALKNWAGLRGLLEIAAANKLQPAIIFYEGA